ncbi:MAG: ABC transporter permease [Flavobacteriales bacterium]
MLEYIIKRILFFIPTILIISLLTFALSVHSPGDPVETIMKPSSSEGQSDRAAKREEYDKMRRKLNLHLPVFYFSVSSLAESDTLYRVPKKLHRENLLRFVDEYGNWEQVQDYYIKLNNFNEYIIQQKLDSLQDDLIALKQTTSELFFKYDDVAILAKFEKIGGYLKVVGSEIPMAANLWSQVKASYDYMKYRTTTWKNYIPTIHFYGFQNQYHLWLTGLFKGDFGVSYYTQETVLERMEGRIWPTFLLSFLSIIIAFAVSIPVGLNSAINKGTTKDKVITISLFMLYSLPSFWIAQLLINYVTNPEYFEWFPNIGLHDFEEGATATEKLLNYAHHLVLPLFCYTYVSFAFISRQMRGSMLQTLSQDYIRTAWAKGLAPKQVYWKHALRNSLLPIITMVASLFPSLIAGSVVIEQLFTLPGMGKLAYEAQMTKDYPVIYMVMLISAILTLIGYLVADILYAIVDPRISYSRK